MSTKKSKIIAVLAVIILAGIYYYVTLPAINIHESGFWFFLAAVVAVILVIYGLRRRSSFHSVKDIKENKIIKVGLGVIILIAVVYLIGSVLSSPIVNAKKYQKLITQTEGDFTEDIEQADFDRIPLLDKDSAVLLGNRKMGSMVDMVSQFQVSDLYSQINYQGKPVRVTPLEYASPIKWLTNQKAGIPAYITIDMTTQNTELVKLNEGIKYSMSEYFNRNIYRHLRFRYPTYMFDQLSFEIDETGTPYWICPVKKFNIGLFGGQTIGRVVLCNAVTGETVDVPVDECPTWVDRVYPAELLIQLYNYHGTLKNGFLNSVLGQKGCLKTTEGFNYIAMDDDVWVYTGITSVTGDRSNVAFVLMNQRTMETRYYPVSGAEEYSAMDSAQGQVQNLGYKATFPLLLNISNEPTYFMALKDEAGLVKKYAMVNIQKYQNVAIGDTVAECQKQYTKLLSGMGISNAGGSDNLKVSGAIEKMAQAVIDGNSHFYITLTGKDGIFDVPVVDFPQIIGYDIGDTISFEYSEDSPANTVIVIE
ncbi:CvpA family protein [Lactonifactor longoviformis]|uniref:CvpA family protein n=1 Tax=Lactonifactor longoviformis TaxID=341220 RepID=UPI0036F271AC